MASLSTAFLSSLLFVMLMLPGFLLNRRHPIGQQTTAAAGRILSEIAMPALILSKLLEARTGDLNVQDALCCLLIPIAVLFPLYGVAACLTRSGDCARHHRIARFCSVFPNCGFFGVPLASALFPERPIVAVYVSLANVTVSVLFLTFGLLMLSGEKSFRPGKIMTSPSIWATALGLLLLTVGKRVEFSFLQTYASHLAALTTPLSMIVLGVELSQVQWRTFVQHGRAVAVVSFSKLLVSPLLVLTAMLLLKLLHVQLSADAANALLIAFSMGTAASAPAMAEQYGLDGTTGAVLTLATTLLCVVTFPGLYGLLGLMGFPF